jgi:hypothetical protein
MKRFRRETGEFLEVAGGHGERLTFFGYSL